MGFFFFLGGGVSLKNVTILLGLFLQNMRYCCCCCCCVCVCVCFTNFLLIWGRTQVYAKVQSRPTPPPPTTHPVPGVLDNLCHNSLKRFLSGMSFQVVK